MDSSVVVSCGTSRQREPGRTLVDIDPDARDRLASEMEARRLDLGFTWRDVAERAALSYEMVMKLRTRVTSVRPLTLRKLDAGLRWSGGSAEEILNGGKPAELDEPPEALRRAVRHLAGETSAASDAERRA